MESFYFEKQYPQGLLCDLNSTPEGYGTVYLITDLTNDKTYVGQTWRNPKARWWGHQHDAKKRATTYLQHAICKRGVDNFTLGILGFARTQEELDNLERVWIVCLNSASSSFGYNLTWGGGGSRATEETREKLSKSRRLYYENPEVLRQKSETSRKMWKNPEIRKKMSEAQTRRFTDPLERKKTGEAIRKGLAKPGVKEKFSQNMKQKWKNPEEIKRQSEASRLALADPEVRERISEGTKQGLKRAKAKRKQEGISEPVRIRVRDTTGKFIRKITPKDEIPEN
jgi:group I intron endonuclease